MQGSSPNTFSDTAAYLFYPMYNAACNASLCIFTNLMEQAWLKIRNGGSAGVISQCFLCAYDYIRLLLWLLCKSNLDAYSDTRQTYKNGHIYSTRCSFEIAFCIQLMAMWIAGRCVSRSHLAAAGIDPVTFWLLWLQALLSNMRWTTDIHQVLYSETHHYWWILQLTLTSKFYFHLISKMQSYRLMDKFLSWGQIFNLLTMLHRH